MPTKRLLRAKDAKFRLLFHDNPQPMCVYDRETQQFLAVNRAAIEHYGYSRHEFLKMRVTDIREPEDLERFREFSDRPAESSHRLAQWRHVLKDGRRIDVEVAVHDIPFGGRKAALAILVDITQRKMLEEQFRQSQKMEAIGLLAGGIAHDFNNLLTIINGYSQLLLNNLPETDENRNAVEQIMKAGERAATLTRQLLAFGRRQVLQAKVLDLNQVVTGLGNMLRRLIGEDIDLRLVLAADLGSVRADPGQIEQVIMNLVVNARDAMPQGGTLTIQTANVVLDESYTGTHVAVKPGAYVLLAVRDNGSGMDEQTLSRLFEPFFTTKAQDRGTGLGLSTVFGIVKQSGGNVEVASALGRGTSVNVYLPSIQLPTAVEPEIKIAHPPRGSETILVVEDEDMLRKLVRETLEQEGYHTLDAPNAAEAQRICETYAEPIQLMITDVIMPKSSGRELVQRVARRRPQMKVLYMSGYADNAILNNGLSDKETAFLQKPFTPATLAQKVRQVLESGNGEKTRHAG